MSTTEEWPEEIPHTCLWYVSVGQPECGKPAVVIVKAKAFVKNVPDEDARRDQYKPVPLCEEHKKVHDESYARRRAAHRTASSK